MGEGRCLKPLASAGVALGRVGGWGVVGQAGVLTLSLMLPVQVAGAGGLLGATGSAIPDMISPLAHGAGVAAEVRRVGAWQGAQGFVP